MPACRTLRTALLSIPALAAVAFAVMPAAALEIATDDPVIKDCMTRALPEKAMTQKLTIQLFEAGKAVNTSNAELFWKRDAEGRSRAIMRMTAPPDRAGIAVLAIERDGPDPELHIYLPESRKARRVAGRTIDGALFGTDFSYEDFSYFQGVASGGDIVRGDDQEVDGVKHLVFSATPAAEGSKYSRIVTFLDPARCALGRMEFYAKNGTLLKELVVPRDDVREIGPRWVPHRVTLNDVKNDSRTEIVVDEIAVDPEINDSLFSPSRFGSAR